MEALFSPENPQVTQPTILPFFYGGKIVRPNQDTSPCAFSCAFSMFSSMYAGQT